MFHSFATAINHLTESCSVGIVRDNNRNIHVLTDYFLYVELAFEVEVGSSAEGTIICIPIRSADTDTVDGLDFVFLHHRLDMSDDISKININIKIFVCRDITTCNNFPVISNQTYVGICAAYIDTY